MLDVLRRTDDPAARLHLVGSPLGETYEPALRAFIEELGLGDAVHLAGSVSGAELEAYFRAADVFVMASDHEGFCVPAGRGHGPRRARSSPTASPPCPRRWAAPGWCCRRQVPGAVRRRRRAGAARPRRCARSWPRPGRARAAEFDLDASTRRFVSLVQQAVGAA